MRHLTALILLVGLLGGCGIMRAQEIEAAWERFDSIASECREKRLRGDLPGFVASHECFRYRARHTLVAAGYPYMDLVDLWLAYGSALSKRMDAGEMTEADAELKAAELKSRINAEAMRRDLAYARAEAERAAAWGAKMQGLGAAMMGWGAMQQSLQPQNNPIHCVTAANTITCY